MSPTRRFLLLLAALQALSACVNHPDSAAPTGPAVAMPGIQASIDNSTPEVAQRGMSNKTWLWTRGGGPSQVHYSTADGRDFAWLVGETRIFRGEWRVDTAGDARRMEGFERVEFFAGGEEFDRRAGDGAHRKRRTAAAVAVGAGQDDARDRDALVERLGDIHRVLTGEAVCDKQRFVRIDRIAHLRHFGHQRIVDVLQAVPLLVLALVMAAALGPALDNTIVAIAIPLIPYTARVIRSNTLTLRELARWRVRHVGFVFQFYNLMPLLTAEQNVELPLLMTHLSKAQRSANVKAALELVGLADRAFHKPAELSGGQQQRVAIARALVADPVLLVCDEPTGDLDREMAEQILDLLQILNREQQKTIVMVTHDPKAAARATRQVHLDKGRLMEADLGVAA